MIERVRSSREHGAAPDLRLQARTFTHLRIRRLEKPRGRTDLREAICASTRIEPLTVTAARLAGEALAVVPTATTIDAFVMAGAALRGDVVLTADTGDMEALRRFFPGVRVLSV
jgi:hypothetical protein